MLLVVLLLAQGAAAQEAPTLTVTPSRGLQDGDTVTVTGGPFPPLVAAGVGQCFGTFDGTDVTSVLTHCELSHAASFDAEGNLVPVSITLREVFAPAAGTEFPIPTHDCTPSNDCSIGLFGFLSDFSTLVGAVAPISFGPAIPSTKADCTHGGWRSFADAGGRPFRSQGQCVRAVVAHRH